MKPLKIIIFLISVLVFILPVLSIFSLISNPENYRFGTEVAGFIYRSEKHYLIMNFSIVALSVLSCITLIRGNIYISIGCLLFGLGLLLI